MGVFLHRKMLLRYLWQSGQLPCISLLQGRRERLAPALQTQNQNIILHQTHEPQQQPLSPSGAHKGKKQRPKELNQQF